MAYEPIRFMKMQSGSGIPPLLHVPEAATQTFMNGTPLALAAGYVQESAFGGTELVYGVSCSPGQGLTVAGTRQDLSEGDPQGWPSAVITPVGAWMREGKAVVIPARTDYIFRIKLQVGDTFSQALVLPNTRYKFVKDAPSGFWFIDKDDTGTNDEHCALIVGVDPASPNSATDAAVFFRFHPSASAWD